MRTRTLAAAALAGTALAAGWLVTPSPSLGAGPCSDPTIQGTSQGETLRGTDDADVIAGAGGDDVLIGLGGDDVLCGGAGQDVLRGGSGADILDGGTDAKVAEDTDYYVYYGDRLDGGPGSDVLDPGSDPRHEGTVDSITFAHAPDGIVLDLRAGTATSKDEELPETDTITGPVATVVGTAYADTMHGSDLPEEIWGGRGSDWISGGAGDDWVGAGDRLGAHQDRTANTLLGGPGDDTVAGDRGNDLLRGDRGADLLDAGRGIDRSYGGSGADSVNEVIEPGGGQVIAGGGGSRDDLSQLTFVDGRGRYRSHLTGRVDLAAGRVTAHYPGRDVGVAVPGFERASTPPGDLWTLLGTDGPNELSAGWFSDPVRIYGRGGPDRVFGSDRDDLINGGSGHDVGTGWGGHDRIVSVENILR